MRLPLLIEGTPNKIEGCATVRLPAGNWRIVVENLLDSILLNPAGTIVNSPIGGLVFSMCFVKKGKETNLSIFAEKI